MIIKYDINKFFKDKGLVKARYAKAFGMSPQLFNYHIKKGDLTISQLQIVAELMDVESDKLIKILNTKYIKHKI